MRDILLFYWGGSRLGRRLYTALSTDSVDRLWLIKATPQFSSYCSACCLWQSNCRTFTGIPCRNCKQKLEQLEGCTRAIVDLASASADVEGNVVPQQVIDTLTAAGYPTTLLEG